MTVVQPVPEREARVEVREAHEVTPDAYVWDDRAGRFVVAQPFLTDWKDGDADVLVLAPARIGRRDFNAECEDRPGVSFGEDLMDKLATLGAKIDMLEHAAPASPGEERPVRVWIDRQHYDFNKRLTTGARLRKAASIPDDFELWYEAPAPDREDVRVPEDQGFALLDDARFYSSPRTISAGVPAGGEEREALREADDVKAEWRTVLKMRAFETPQIETHATEQQARDWLESERTEYGDAIEHGAVECRAVSDWNACTPRPLAHHPWRALGRIQAWSRWHKEEARSQLRGTMKVIHEEASAALAAPSVAEAPVSSEDEREGLRRIAEDFDIETDPALAAQEMQECAEAALARKDDSGACVACGSRLIGSCTLPECPNPLNSTGRGNE